VTAAEVDPGLVAEVPAARKLQAWDEEQEQARQVQRALGRRLREIRKAAGLSLQAVEEKSDGVWKAVVVGSYERGDRSMAIHRLVRLCDWYGVTIWDVVPGPPAVAALIADVEARAEARVAELTAGIEREQREAARRLAARMLGQVAATIIAGVDVDSPERAARQAADAVFEAAGFTAVNPPGAVDDAAEGGVPRG
jgi:transcriptional regulator with XRE-family HTH domain